MALYTNLPVYEDCYQLLSRLVSYSRNMQRDFRYTLGVRLKTIVVDIMILIFKANKSREKIQYIAEAREKMVEVQITTRILNDMKQLSDKQYMLLAEQIVTVSKQLAAWEKSNYNQRNKTEEKIY